MRILALALLLVACGGKRLPELTLDDARLTADSRRLLADSEDEVAIATAGLQDAQAVLDRERDWRGEIADRLTGEDGSMRRALGQLADERVAVAKAAVEVARQRRALAEARLEMTRGDTVARHDLAVVDMEPIEKEVERARQRVAEAERAHADARAAAETQADAAWARWRELAKGGEPPLALFIP